MAFDRWAIVEGHYWFYVDFHQGQDHKWYSRLSIITTYYKPGYRREPSTEEAGYVYKELVKKYFPKMYKEAYGP